MRKGGIRLGNNVTISATAKLISTSYETDNWKSNSKLKNHFQKPIQVGDDAWICAGATILPGVTISGKGVIVAANSVVNKDITEDYVLVAGSPAKIKKYLN